MRGSVHRVANGTWMYRFDLGKDPLTGKRRTSTKRGFATQRDAQSALRDAIKAHEGGRSGRTVGADCPGLPRRVARVRAGAGPGHDMGDLPRVSHLLRQPPIGETRLSELTAVRLNLLYGHLLTDGRIKGPGGLSAKTVQTCTACCTGHSRTPSSGTTSHATPQRGRRTPRRRTRPRVWSPEQLRQVHRAGAHDRFYALWLLVVTTGFRRGELSGLCLQDLDLDYARVSPASPASWSAGRPWSPRPRPAAGSAGSPSTPRPRRAARLPRHMGRGAAAPRPGGRTAVRVAGRSTPAPGHHHLALPRPLRGRGPPPIRLHDVRHSYATAALKAGVPARSCPSDSGTPPRPSRCRSTAT